jgi:hypothetical protein
MVNNRAERVSDKIINILHDFGFTEELAATRHLSDQDYEPYGTCCPEHFQDMMITNVFTQLETLLQTVDVIRYNGVEIPFKLIQKMFRIAHLAGARCSYDNCSASS